LPSSRIDFRLAKAGPATPTMVDPAKATKGRRMSKKTRKKSPKPASPKATRARPAKSAKAPSSKASGAKTIKSGKKATGKTGAATSKASHKAPSKPLKKSDPAAAPKPALAEGAKAPAFRLPRDGGSIVSLSEFSGQKLVLFFYPRADTPGCTKEAIDFTRLSSAFGEIGTAVLGVSADPLRAQEAFRDKHGLAMPLISDEAHAMLEAYGVWGEKSMYGKTFQGIVRTTIVIGADGRILKIWRNVRVDGHADEVLATVRANS
jgi:thioredoxin-dependent peroxiredoxin